MKKNNKKIFVKTKISYDQIKNKNSTNLANVKNERNKEKFVLESNKDKEIEEIELHKKGIIISAKFNNKEKGEIVYIKVEENSKEVKIIVKNPPMERLKTNGIAKWGGGYKVFYPNKDNPILLIGESVRAEMPDSVVLNNTSVVKRVDNLCGILAYLEPEQEVQVRKIMVELMESYVQEVMQKNKLASDKRNYIIKKVKSIENATTNHIAEQFNDLKKELDKIIQTKKEMDEHLKR